MSQFIFIENGTWKCANSNVKKVSMEYILENGEYVWYVTLETNEVKRQFIHNWDNFKEIEHKFNNDI